MKRVLSLITLLCSLIILTGCLNTSYYQNEVITDFDKEEVQLVLDFFDTLPSYTVEVVVEDKLYDLYYPRTFNVLGNKAELLYSDGLEMNSQIYEFNDELVANRHYDYNSEPFHIDLTMDDLIQNGHDYVGYAYLNILDYFELRYQKCLYDGYITKDEFRYEPKTNTYFFYSEKYNTLINEYIESYKQNLKDEGSTDFEISMIMYQLGLSNPNFNSSNYSLLAFSYEIENDEIVSINAKSNLGGININWNYSNFNNVTINDFNEETL